MKRFARFGGYGVEKRVCGVCGSQGSEGVRFGMCEICKVWKEYRCKAWSDEKRSIVKFEVNVRGVKI